VYEVYRPETSAFYRNERHFGQIVWRQSDDMPRGPRNFIEMAYRLLQHRQGKGWEFWFGTPDRVSDWHVYQHEYIDELNFMPPAAELFEGWELGDQLLASVGERLKGIGWDGEGIFQVFWLPPFLRFLGLVNGTTDVMGFWSSRITMVFRGWLVLSRFRG